MSSLQRSPLSETQFSYHHINIAEAKSKLIDLLCEETNLDELCAKAVRFICDTFRFTGGAFYFNSSQNMRDWTMQLAYPSLPAFSALFHFNVGYRFIVQAAMERSCFSISNTNIARNITLFFLPVIHTKMDTVLGVMVQIFQCRCKLLNTHKRYLDHHLNQRQRHRCLYLI